jgi:hypothetical protein
VNHDLGGVRQHKEIVEAWVISNRKKYRPVLVLSERGLVYEFLKRGVAYRYGTVPLIVG